MSRFSGREVEQAWRMPVLQGKWPSFDWLTEPRQVTTAPDFAPFADDETYPNPFVTIQDLGPEWASRGMDSESMVAAAIALGGLPKPNGETGDRNLQRYAEEIQELHGTQAGGQQ